VLFLDVVLFIDRYVGQFLQELELVLCSHVVGSQVGDLFLEDLGVDHACF